MYSVASFESLPEGEAIESNQALPRSPLPSDPLEQESSKYQPADKAASVWAKRRNVALELLETERAFVASLRIVNEHYYQPLIALSRGPACQQQAKHTCNAAPALSRKAISEIFSNFSDILHLNTELLSRLEERLSGRNRASPNSRPVSLVDGQQVDAPGAKLNPESKNPSPPPWDARSDQIGDLLAPMAPFLKMYSLYVKNFSSALARIEAERKANDAFARFLKETERLTWMTSTSGRPGGFGFGLGLQAHLLTIVQRIPRYKLLVGELIACTPSNHKDRADLARAFMVIEQVAESINENIRHHEMVLSMLDIQRSLVGLTVPLIVPGRTLLKKATMLKAGRKDIHAREFFLFSDCIMYAAPIGGAMTEASAAWQAFSRYGSSAVHNDNERSNGATSSPSFVRYAQSPIRSFSPDKRPDIARRRTTSVPTRVDPKRLSLSAFEGQQMQFRGKFALQDCTVVGVENATSHDPALRHYIEIRTPGKSFAVYAESLEAKQEWLGAIRSAREELMSNRRTLQADEDSIAAKRDRRRSLQAVSRNVSFPRMSDTSPSAIPEGTSVTEFGDMRNRRESLPSFGTSASLASYLGAATLGSGGADVAGSDSRGGLKILEEYNAPVWVPDNRADKCACCSEAFGLWRRKHHCRLCGQVVCWSCSQRTFLIASYEDGEQDRPARACDPCYESVFPETGSELALPSTSATPSLANPTDPRSSQVLDSDVSVSSTPPTPTSPHAAPHALAPDAKRTSIVSLSAVDENTEVMVHHSIERHLAVESSGHPIRQAPAARIAKAHASNAQVTHGKMLSPQVHAATSGTGTFRLVTPRLTTPEHERPPVQRSVTMTADGEANDADEESSHATHPVGPSASASEHQGAGDYFSAAFHSHSGQGLQHHARAFPLLAPRRRKPMSAAARLSSVYSAALPPQPQ
jgi:hypothetical protein